jgi:hypothetical protein
MTNNYQFTLETPMAVTGARWQFGRKLASVFSTSAPNGNRFEQEDGPTNVASLSVFRGDFPSSLD